MAAFTTWMDRFQVPLYLGAILIGAMVGLTAPHTAPSLSPAITPVLALLLFATFLGIPLTALTRSLGDLRFLGTVSVVNFLVVPVVVFALTRFIADDRGLLIGVLLVLLTPCVDYVIVFTGLAGGSRERLLAATPVLMLLQIVLLPVYLLLFAGPDAVAVIEIAPFVEAFIFLIAIPLGCAVAVQLLGRSIESSEDAVTRRSLAPILRFRTFIERGMLSLMVPLMMTTLALVVASQIAAVGTRLPSLIVLLPLFAAFLVVMLAVGILAGRISGLDVAGRRALIFSGSTRNSLVVLPLALALPPELGIAPPAVVTQTLVELVGMVVFVRLVPALTREPSPTRT